MRSPNSSLICILGWLKSNLGVVLLCFALVLICKFLVKKGKLPISEKSNALRLGVGALA